MIKLRELGGHYRCTIRREAALSVQKERTTLMNKGAIIRSIIKGSLVPPVLFKNWQEAEDAIEATFQEAEDDAFMNQYEKQAIKDEVIKLSSRFLSWIQTQDLTGIQPAKTKVVKVGNNEVSVTPAWVRIVKAATPEDVDFCEVVLLSSSKRSISPAGRSDDTCSKSNLQLYALLQYGKEMLPKGGVIQATYYFLKKKDKDAELDSDYTTKDFVASARLVYIPGVLATGEQAYLDAAKRFDDGTKCSKSQCEKCEFIQLCNFIKPPVALEKEEQKQKQLSYSFSPEQMKIIQFADGYGRANCGAGAGKTTVVVQNVLARLLSGATPESLLLITFTNTGCKEMRVRLSEELESYGVDDVNVDDIKITTFNGLGDEVIRNHWEELGYPNVPILADKIDRMGILVSLLDKYPEIAGFNYKYPLMDQKHYQGVYPALLSLFTEIKAQALDNFKSLKKAHPEFEDESLKMILQLYHEFADEMKAQALIDYADQEQAIFKMLDENMFLFSDDYAFEYIIVDEFQDSNALQLEIIKALCNTDYFRSLLVVGDDSQSIFGFRGTSPDNIINFPTLIGEKITDFFLVNNYRSTPEILEVANYVNDLNTHKISKKLISQRPNGKRPVLKAFDDAKAEVNWIASQIEAKVKDGVPLSDMVYIARTKSELGRMQTELTNRGIVSIFDVPEPILENSRVQAAIELAQYFKDPLSTKSLMVYLDAVIDNQFLNLTTKQSEAFLEANKKDYELKIPDLSEEEKVDFFMNLLTVLADGDDLYEEFLKSVQNHNRHQLYPLLDYILMFKKYSSDITGRHVGDFDAIKLTTVHSSKGMEWQYVFSSLTQYDVPGRSYTMEEIEENRRLLFVAFTRARDELYVSSTRYAGGAKDAVGRRLNRFFSELRRCAGFDVEDVKNAK